jgi:glycosyltransferase involved in cell wall biosynthesis
MAVGFPRAVMNQSPMLAQRGRLPRVLYAVAMQPGRKFGSFEEQITLLAQAFDREHGRFLPLFLSDPKTASLDDFHRRGIAARCIDPHRARFAGLQSLCQLVREERIDLIHWNFTEPIKNSLLWGLTVNCPRLTHWFTNHISHSQARPPSTGVKRWLKSMLLRRYGKVVCVSRFVERTIEQEGHWSNLISQKHFINTDRFMPNSTARTRVRHQYDATRRFVVLYVGQLIAEKGIDVAVEALASLPSEAALWIVGDGPHESRLTARIAELGLENRVRMFGLQSDVEPFYQAADVFICPSMWAEAAGLVNLEAQSCGVPVVASRVGGIPEYVAEGRTGFLIEPGDSAELARQILRLIDDADLCRVMAVNARAWALEHFSPEVRIPELLDLYRTGF